jgi:hypothetical protein
MNLHAEAYREQRLLDLDNSFRFLKKEIKPCQNAEFVKYFVWFQGF